MKNKLSNSQQRTEELTQKNLDLQREVDETKLQLREIHEFLTNELKAKELQNIDLEKRLAELQEKMETQQDSYEKTLAETRTSNSESTAQLQECVAR